MHSMLEQLLAVDVHPKITLQIPAGTERRERSLRLRHQLEKLSHALEARDVAPAKVTTIVEQAEALAENPALADARSGAGGIYLAGSFSRSVLWPAPLAERTYVANDFHLIDVVSLLDPSHCFVLTLSKSGVELFRADALSVSRVELEGVPASLAEASKYLDAERQLQFHQAQSVGRGGPAAMFHGHGIGEGRDIEELRKYLRAVDHGVCTAIGSARAPIGLIGIGEIPATYRAISSVSDLIREIDRKDPGAVDGTEVRAVADQLLQQTSRENAAALHARIGDLVGAGRASTNLQAIVGAALKGRVEAILFGPSRGGNDSAINTAALATLRGRGDVMEHGSLPEDHPVEALFRY
jgi:hypothetical protein